MSIDRRSVIGGGLALTAATGLGRARARSSAESGSPGFLWGAATAAHQIEGQNINSDYWVLEHIPATYFKESSGDACDSLNRWREDLALVKAGGMNAYRFSIEWARIEPAPGEFSQAALDHYRRICIACRELGIEPVVTFHHFTSPRWIAARGGWENPKTADDYARYVAVAAKALAGCFDWACTLNEPNAQVMSKVILKDKPWDKEPAILAQAARAVGSDRWGSFFLGNPYRVRDTCLVAHRKGRDAIKSTVPGAKVGMTLALQWLTAGPGGEALYRRTMQEARVPFYETARSDDFVGVQTYNHSLIGPDGYLPDPPTEIVSMFKQNADPMALVETVTEAHRATRIPVLVSENGIMTDRDPVRVQHLRRTVANLAKAIDGGMPVLGYIHWSLLDNFEWSSGYVPRFGLVDVDRETFRRTPKPSLAAYRQLIGEMRATHRWA